MELVDDMTWNPMEPVSDGIVPTGKGLRLDSRDRCLHLAGRLLGDLLTNPLTPLAAVFEKAPEALDGVPLLPFLLFFTRPVTGRVVGRRVGPVAVGHGLDQSGALT